ncbi:hypothetical protein STIAU_6484 [Stigmatella aurantiaca DW4/3-1]|uniref:Uncharacterized protein n=1 Tax=Stigmatella aurantiaca (strain DW4/3-1) TaxID=378806 RepID=Q08YT0_STIAD|nr:hypothetical protein STIAU_6484 [Stigmatella aurantiaca DW4/3-1]
MRILARVDAPHEIDDVTPEALHAHVGAGAGPGGQDGLGAWGGRGLEGLAEVLGALHGLDRRGQLELGALEAHDVAERCAQLRPLRQHLVEHSQEPEAVPHRAIHELGGIERGVFIDEAVRELVPEPPVLQPLAARRGRLRQQGEPLARQIVREGGEVLRAHGEQGLRLLAPEGQLLAHGLGRGQEPLAEFRLHEEPGQRRLERQLIHRERHGLGARRGEGGGRGPGRPVVRAVHDVPRPIEILEHLLELLGEVLVALDQHRPDLTAPRHVLQQPPHLGVRVHALAVAVDPLRAPPLSARQVHLDDALQGQRVQEGVRIVPVVLGVDEDVGQIEQQTAVRLGDDPGDELRLAQGAGEGEGIGDVLDQERNAEDLLHLARFPRAPADRCLGEGQGGELSELHAACLRHAQVIAGEGGPDELHQLRHLLTVLDVQGPIGAQGGFQRMRNERVPLQQGAAPARCSRERSERTGRRSARTSQCDPRTSIGARAARGGNQCPPPGWASLPTGPSFQAVLEVVETQPHRQPEPHAQLMQTLPASVKE